MLVVTMLLSLPTVVAAEGCYLLSESREIDLPMPQRMGGNRILEKPSLICGDTLKLHMRAFLVSQHESGYETVRQNRWKLNTFKETPNVNGRLYHLPLPQSNTFKKFGRGVIAYTCIDRWGMDGSSHSDAVTTDINPAACGPKQSAVVIISRMNNSRKYSDGFCSLRAQNIQNGLSALILDSGEYTSCSSILGPNFWPEINKSVFFCNIMDLNMSEKLNEHQVEVLSELVSRGNYAAGYTHVAPSLGTKSAEAGSPCSSPM